MINLFLKEVREKRGIIYRRTTERMKIDFLSEMMQGKDNGEISLKY